MPGLGFVRGVIFVVLQGRMQYISGTEICTNLPAQFALRSAHLSKILLTIDIPRISRHVIYFLERSTLMHHDSLTIGGHVCRAPSAMFTINK